MKEIKVRVWDKEAKEMLIYDLIENMHEYEDNCIWIGEKTKNGYGVDLSSKEVMQYTGIKDKNGKEIYEGDIVDEKYEGKFLRPREVKWDAEGAMWDMPRLLGGDEVCDEIEVIGNVYENPDLLKDEE